MRPRKRIAAEALPGARGAEETTNRNHETHDHRDDSTPWRVLVDGRHRDMVWGRYASRAGAEATARNLRKHGFIARVERPAL